MNGSSTIVSGLTAGTSYQFQVLAGCARTVSTGTWDTLSAWSVVATFQTATYNGDEVVLADQTITGFRRIEGASR